MVHRSRRSFAGAAAVSRKGEGYHLDMAGVTQYHPFTPPMVAYYLTENAAKAVEVAGRTFTFEAVEYFQATNSVWGTLAVESEEDIAALEEAVKLGRATRISEADYQKMEVKKNKPQPSPNLIALKHWHAPQMGHERQAAAPAEAANPPAELESVDDVVAPKPATKKAPAVKK